MRRLAAVLFLLAAATAAVAGYTTIARERRFRQLIAQGDGALARGDTYLAIEAFSGAILLKDSSMLAYLRRGETYQRRGNDVAAQRDLRTAARLDPSATRPLEDLGDLNYTLRRYARAAEYYADCVRLDDGSPRMLYKLGLARYRAGRVAAAAEPLSDAVALEERFAEAHYLQGLVLRDLHRTDEAVASLRRAVEISPALVDARGELADLFRTLGRTADEIQQLEALAALDARPNRQIALGLAYARSGRTDRAVLALGNAVERYPEHAAAYVALGRVWLAIAESRPDRVALSKAVEALEGAIAAGAASSEALTLFGRALLVVGDLEAAERMLAQASSRLPVDPNAFTSLAEAAERLGHADIARRALISYRTLVGETPAEVGRRAGAARVAALAARSGDWTEAAAWYARAVDELQGAPSAMLLGRLADAEWRAGRADAARAALARALEIAPTNRTLLALQRRIR